MTLAYSYIKLQVWVLIEYNNWIATAITVLVSHHKHTLKGSNFSHSENRVSRDCQSSLVTLAYFYIKLQVWVLLIAAVITVLVTHHQHALNRYNFSLSKNRVSRDCQSSLVTSAYSYIKLQVWVLIEYNTYDYCCNHSGGNKSPACLKKI